MPLFTNSLNLSLGCCPEVAILCVLCASKKKVSVFQMKDLEHLISWEKLSPDLPKGKFGVAFRSLYNPEAKTWVSARSKFEFHLCLY